MAGRDGDADSPDRPWDARLARRFVAPLRRYSVSPNHLTTLRLLVGLGAAAAFLPGTYGSANAGALLLVVSNFLDHADGELARMSGKTSRFGHVYDLFSDALVTIGLFVAIGVGMGAAGSRHGVPAAAQGAIAGISIALIFYLRMRIEAVAGKAATRQASIVGFETEDVLYLMPLATLTRSLEPLLTAAAYCAPLYLAWVVVEHRRILSSERVLSS